MSRLNYQRREDGFTMVEIMVVVLIIAILASIAIPSYLEQRRLAIDTVVQNDVKSVATAIDSYMSQKQVVVVPHFKVARNDGSTATSITPVSPTTAATMPSGANPITEIRISEGTTIVVAGSNTGSFTITGSSVDGDKSVINGSTGGIKYDSRVGGFLD